MLARWALCACLLVPGADALAQPVPLSPYHEWFNSQVEPLVGLIIKGEILPRATDREKRVFAAVRYRVVKIGDERDADCSRASGPAYTRRLADRSYEIVVCATATRYLMDAAEAFMFADIVMQAGRVTEDKVQQILAYYLGRGVVASNNLVLGRPAGKSCVPMSILYLYATSQVKSGCDLSLAEATVAKVAPWWFRDSGVVPMLNAIRPSDPPLSERNIVEELEAVARSSGIPVLTFVLAHEFGHIVNDDLAPASVLKRNPQGLAVEAAADEWAVRLVARPGGETDSLGLLSVAGSVLAYVGALASIGTDGDIDSSAGFARMKASSRLSLDALKRALTTEEGRQLLREIPALARQIERMEALHK